MDRRTFLKYASFLLLHKGFHTLCPIQRFEALAGSMDPIQIEVPNKTRFFDTQGHVSGQDFFLSPEKMVTLKQVLDRLVRIQQTVGYGNFGLFGFAEMLQTARNYSSIGSFPKPEIEFLETIFYHDAKKYGFLGEKVFPNITEVINKSKLIKIPETGNYLFCGVSAEKFRRISQDIGDHLMLTAGVRGVAKQFYLFFKKAYACGCNLSKASRAIAPPGYSYHGLGDFDVGQAGFGAANFSTRFIHTPVYQELKRLEYVDFRYPYQNRSGVQFEPWHIKVV